MSDFLNSPNKVLTVSIDAVGNRHFQLLDIWCKANDKDASQLDGMEEQEAVQELVGYALESVNDILEKYTRQNTPTVNCMGLEIKVNLSLLSETMNSVSWGFETDELLEIIVNSVPFLRDTSDLERKFSEIVDCENCKIKITNPEIEYGEIINDPTIAISFDIPYLEYVRGKGNGRGRKRDPDTVEQKTEEFYFHRSSRDLDDLGNDISDDIHYRMRNAFDRGLVSSVSEEAAQWVKEHPFDYLTSSQISQIDKLFSDVFIKRDYIRLTDKARKACNMLIPSIRKYLSSELKVYKMGELTPLIPFIQIQEEEV